MNREVVQSVGEFSPPSGKSCLSRTIAVNIWGDLFFLCDGGEIRYVSLKKEGNEASLSQALPLDDNNAYFDACISNIEFNYSGSILLVASPYFAGVVLLPRAFTFDGSHSLHGEDINCKCKELFKCADEDSIVKIQWHPLSEKHIVILLRSSKLVVIDVVESVMQEYLLDISVDYKSFCFGPPIDWLKLTIFLLHTNGDVSYLCPILPQGSVLSSKSVTELRAWHREQLPMDFDHRDLNSSAENFFEAYLDMASIYLRAAFGTENSSERFVHESAIHRAGIQKSNVGLANGSKLFEAFYRRPVLQGPIIVEGRVVKQTMFKSDGAASACDICVPGSSGNDACPMLLVVWSNGDIEQLVIGANVSPSWDMRGEGQVYMPEVAPLIHMETITLSISDENESSHSVPKDCYYFIPDPVSCNHFHVVGPDTGKSYMISIPSIMDQEEGSTTAIVVYDKPNRISTSSAVANKDKEGLVGVAVIADPALGHVALFRSSDGFMSAMNMTVQLRLVQLEKHLKQRNDESEMGAATDTRSDLAWLEHKEYSLRWISSKLLSKAQRGIETVPRMHRRDQATAAECMDALVSAKEHLEANTLLPLEQLLQRTQFTEGIIRDVYECQTEILQGNAEGGDAGYANRLKVILDQQIKLKARIDAVGATLERQKNLAASALSVSISTQAKISHAEKVYATQVRNWQAVCERLQASISTLQQSKGFISAISSPSIVSPKPTPKPKQSPLPGPHLPASSRRDMNQSQRGAYGSSSPFFASPRRKHPSVAPTASYSSPGGHGRDSFSNPVPPIYLTQEEIEACEQLLGAEQDMLRVTDKATISLEERLRSLAQSI